jgi:hypothetical protein
MENEKKTNKKVLVESTGDAAYDELNRRYTILLKGVEEKDRKIEELKETNKSLADLNKTLMEKHKLAIENIELKANAAVSSNDNAVERVKEHYDMVQESLINTLNVVDGLVASKEQDLKTLKIVLKSYKKNMITEEA